MGEDKDVTQVGTIGLKGLKGLNINLSNSEIKSFESRELIGRTLTRGTMTTPMKEYIGTPELGMSRYDLRITHTSELTDLNETRANLQPVYDKILAGTAKGVVLAATTFADTFVGTVMGLAEFAGTGLWSKLWDNKGTRFLNNINNTVESILPNYYTQLEIANNDNGEWYKNVFSANFIGDALLKNAGFMVGAYLSGKIVAGAAAKLMGFNEARKAYEGYTVIANDGKKALTLAEKIKMAATGNATIDGKAIVESTILDAKRLRIADPILRWTGSVSGAMGESRLEAVSNTEDYFNKHKELLDNYKPELIKNELSKLFESNPELFSLKQDGEGGYTKELTEEGLKILDKNVENKYNQGLLKITEQRIKLGNRDFWTNMVLLSGSDFVLFGRQFAGGFKNAKKINDIVKTVTDDAKILYSAPLKSRLAKVWSIAKTPIIEGPVEEMGQAAINRTLQLYYGAQFNSLMGAQVDPEAHKESIDWLNAMGEGLKRTYGTMAGYEEGFIGGLMGGFGVPSISRVEGASGNKSKLKVNWGGSIGEYKKASQEDLNKQELVLEMNKNANDPRLQEYFKDHTRGTVFNKDSQTALDANDEFEYKNAAHSALISSVITYDKVGRILDLYDIVNSFTNLNEDNISQVREELVKKGDPSIPYKDKTDADLVEYMKERSVKTIKLIDKYREIADALATKSGDTFRGDDLQELTWMLSKIDNWESRFRDIHKTVKETATPILKGKTYKDEEGIEHRIDDVLDQSPAELLDALTIENNPAYKVVNKSILQRVKDETDLTKAISELETKIKDKTDKKGLFSMTKRLENLKQELVKNKATSTKIDDLLKDLTDMGRLAGARIAFLDRYNSYIANPERLKLDILEIKLKANKESKKNLKDADKTKNSPIEKDLDSSKTYEEFKLKLNTIEDSDLATDITTKLAKEDSQFAKHHIQMTELSADVKNQIRKSNISDDAKEIANFYFNENAKASNTIAELLNPSSIIYTSSAVDPETGEPYDPEVTKLAVNIVREAVVKANSNRTELNKTLDIPNSTGKGLFDPFKKNSNATKILLTPEENQPPIPTEEFMVLGEEEIIPTKVETSIQPATSVSPLDLNPLSIKEDNLTTSIGSKDINKKIADSVTNSVNLTDVYYPAIPELEVSNKHEGIKFIDITKDDGTLKYEGFIPLYDYLTEHGTWKYLNTIGSIKKGDKVGFYIDEEFERANPKAAGTIFITHGKDNLIIGVLKGDTAIMSHKGLKSLRSRIRSQYNKNKNNNDIKENTTILQVNPGYTIVNTSIPDRDLKGLDGLDESKVILGIGFDDGEVKVNNFNGKIVQPEKAKSGMPYLYQLNADGAIYPTPLTVKRFNSKYWDNVDNRNSPVGNKLEQAVRQLSNAKSSTQVDEAFLLIGLNLSLTNGTRITHISLSKSGDSIVIYETDPVTKVNSNPKNIYIKKQLTEQGLELDIRGPVDIDSDTIYNELMDNLLSRNLLFDINAKQINEGSYNKEIIDSNILNTNLTKAGFSSVWFFLNPVREDGTIETLDKAPIATPTTARVINKRTNPANSTETVREGTPIMYKGTQYYVKDGIIRDESNSIVKLAFSNAILELAYIKNLSKEAREKRNLGDGWYLLKDGVTKFNIKTMSYESTAPKLPKAMSVKDLKIEIIESSKQTLIPTTTSKSSNNLDDMDFGDFAGEETIDTTLYREITPVEYKVWNQKEELGWLEKNLPNVSKQDLLHIHKGLKTISDKGTQAWGMFNKTGMHIADGAMQGTVYHEAFHLAYWMLTDSSTRQAIDNDAKLIWGNLNQTELNEKMAEAFRDYVETNIMSKKLTTKIKNFFNQLLSFIGIKNNTSVMNNFFRLINEGKFAKQDLVLDKDFYLNKLQESLDKSRKMSNFDTLDSSVKRNLKLKGYNLDTWNLLTDEEKEHEVKCATI